jgi:ATP-dependent DNA ligase
MIPTLVTKPPPGDEWLHEIKYDGYRMQLVQTGKRARLFTRSGRDWTKRYPRVIEATKVISASSYVLDGELVVADARGVSSFEMLHSRKHDAAAILWAFDLLLLNGDDLRRFPLEERKEKLARLLKGYQQDGIAFSDHLYTDGATMFEIACKLGVEGIVSKLRDSQYISGRTKAWLKTKNPNAPGMTRFQDRE